MEATVEVKTKYEGRDLDTAQKTAALACGAFKGKLLRIQLGLWKCYTGPAHQFNFVESVWEGQASQVRFFERNLWKLATLFPGTSVEVVGDALESPPSGSTADSIPSTGEPGSGVEGLGEPASTEPKEAKSPEGSASTGSPPSEDEDEDEDDDADEDFSLPLQESNTAEEDLKELPPVEVQKPKSKDAKKRIEPRGKR